MSQKSNLLNRDHAHPTTLSQEYGLGTASWEESLHLYYVKATAVLPTQLATTPPFKQHRF